MTTLWVIEILERGKWMPTVGAHLTRDSARSDLWEWRVGNPHDKFRIARYKRATFAR